MYLMELEHSCWRNAIDNVLYVMYLFVIDVFGKSRIKDVMEHHLHNECDDEYIVITLYLMIQTYDCG